MPVRSPLRRAHDALGVLALVVGLATALGCAGAAEPLASRATTGATGTTIVIGGVPATTPPDTAPPSTEPPSTLAPKPPYEPTDAFRKLTAAGIPDLAARSYLNASLRAPDALPNCKMSPEVLAAVGMAESRHGTIGSFDEDGTSREIIKGYTHVGDDTDDGKLDGDEEKDYAVGPMQFTPETWTGLGRDGNGDANLDPSNFYDAALATTAYLCHLAGPFTDAFTIAAQWDQWDKQKTQLEQRTKLLHEQWERQKKQREELEQIVRDYPDDTTNAAVLARLPPLGPEPEYKEPDRPAGPAQLRQGVERYYGPEGDVRDEYRDNVESHFRDIVARTGGVKVTEADRLT